MQFEDFDNKLRQAAEQHHPSYDEKAWAKMDKLLDEHLPVKDDRRRRFIFLLFSFLLLGGGTWLLVSRPWQQKDNVVSVSPKTVQAEPLSSGKPAKDITNKTEDTNPNGEKISTPKENSTVTSASPASTDLNKTNDLTATDAPGLKADQDRQTTGTSRTNNTIPSQSKSKPARNKDQHADQLASFDVTDPAKAKKTPPVSLDKTTVQLDNTTTVQPVNTNDNNAEKTIAGSKPVQADKPVDINKTQDKPVEEKKVDPLKTEAASSTTKKEATKKSGTKKSNYLFFSFSVAPDLSYIGLNEPGKVKLLAGAGVGYTFNKRWTIRTGFYTADKVYTASKYNYKPDGGLINPTYLDKIDADCKVYEVPLNLSYNFSKSDKNNFFATAGLSSFFMKKEEYRYLYQYPGPPITTYTYTKTVNNENKHYFSILTLSAGYSRSLNNTFSISAEPYFKLPLSGIGYGKVKLNSAGVLLSVNIKPFH